MVVSLFQFIYHIVNHFLLIGIYIFLNDLKLIILIGDILIILFIDLGVIILVDDNKKLLINI